MTIKEVEIGIAGIKRMALDPGVAHALEDSLYYNFMQYIAKQDKEFGHLAKLILSTKQVKFIRRCE